MANEQSQQHEPEGHKRFNIQIDRVHYSVTQDHLSGAELRQLPSPPIGQDRDLFEVVPGGTDIKIDEGKVVEIRNGERFFTAPSQINPGNNSGGLKDHGPT